MGRVETNLFLVQLGCFTITMVATGRVQKADKKSHAQNIHQNQALFMCHFLDRARVYKLVA
eukprot:SAG31_NODE_4360_length_3312_cov_2.190787_4_plen_61_part_00